MSRSSKRNGALPLSGADKRKLRSLAHHMTAVVMVGKDGISDGIIQAVDQALTDHELIKVRLPQVDKAERSEMAETLRARTRAELAGLTGRVAILYRRHPDRPHIEL